MLTHLSDAVRRSPTQAGRLSLTAATVPCAADERFSSEAGLTLIQILIAVVIATIFAVATYQFVNLSSSKGKALYDSMASVAHAAEAFNLSLGAYPTVYAAMSNPKYGDSASYNTNGTDLSNTWNGPYAKNRDVGPNGNLHLNSISTGLTITFAALTAGSTGSLPTGLEYQYAVVANNVPNAIATEAVDVCNGQAGNTGASDGGQCVLVPGTGKTSTVYYIFAQNQYGAY
ncbi:type IV pilus modification PilV family protein [Acidithiobacillus caldus]